MVELLRNVRVLVEGVKGGRFIFQGWRSWLKPPGSSVGWREEARTAIDPTGLSIVISKTGRMIACCGLQHLHTTEVKPPLSATSTTASELASQHKMR